MGHESDKRLIFANLLWSIITGALSYLINFFITPIITNRLGIEAYGFVSLGNQIISYVNIISVGLNSFAARYIGTEYYRGNIKRANSFYSSVLGANLFLSLIVLLPAASVIARLERVINIPEKLQQDVKILFLILLVNYFLGLLGGVYSSIAFLKNKISGTSKIKAISVITYAILLAVAFQFYELKVYYVALANVAATVNIVLGNRYYAGRVVPELHAKLKNFSVNDVKTLVSSGIYNSINSLGGTLGSGLDLLITNLMLSTVVMGQIAIGNQIGGILNIVVTLVANAFQPKQLEVYSKRKLEELTNWLISAMKMCSIVSLTFWGGFIFLGRSFFQLWIPGEDCDLVFMISAIVISGNLIVAIVTPLFYVPTLTDKMRFVCVVTLFCGVVNVLSMLILLKIFNVGAYIVVGTTAVLDIITLIVFPYITKKYLKISIKNILHLMIRHFVLAIGIAILYISIPIQLELKSWREFCVKGIILGSIFMCLSSLVMLNKKDKYLLGKMIARKLGGDRDGLQKKDSEKN